MKYFWMLAVGALAFAACAESGGVSAEGAGEGETGALNVTVQNLRTFNDVKRVDIEIKADSNKVPNTAVDQPTIELTAATQGVNVDGASNPGVWTFTAEALPVGHYLVSAKAYDDAAPTPQRALLFQGVRDRGAGQPERGRRGHLHARADGRPGFQYTVQGLILPASSVEHGGALGRFGQGAGRKQRRKRLCRGHST